MYIALFTVLVVGGGLLFWNGIRNKKRVRIVAGIVLLLTSVSLAVSMGLWGEMLWFESLGFGSRFWTALTAATLSAVVSALFAFGLFRLLASSDGHGRQPLRYWSGALAVLIGAGWGWANWPLILKFWYAAESDVSEPIFGLGVSFYLFTLPFLRSLLWLLFTVSVLSVLAALGQWIGMQRLLEAANKKSSPFKLSSIGSREAGDEEHSQPLSIAGSVPLQLAFGALVVVGALWMLLQPFELMYSQNGVVYGPGWTDVFIRMPAYYASAGFSFLAGLVLISDSILRRGRDSKPSRKRLIVVGSPVAAAAVCWLVGIMILPQLSQWLYVQPNEISVERPFIEHNIRLTRKAFGLDAIETQSFPVSGEFDEQVAEENRQVLSQVRLWDPRALDSVYEQFQEIRLYYEFDDVDIDRYTIGDEYRQVMVSPREMSLQNLPQQSQTFVNRRFKYTHGYGLTMAPVNEFTKGGLPKLLIKDLPPQSTDPDLQVKRPEIYYGELTRSHVVVNSGEKEFDYPSGENNVYTHYQGDGGVQLSNLWRRFLYGWRFDGTRFFVSSYLTRQSRVMFRRQVHERVRALAPFLRFDEDAYVVLDNGRIYWIIDAYTVSGEYPYSQPFQSGGGSYRHSRSQSQTADYLDDANYLRNSVKAVINAYDGSVDFYVFEPEDPIIQTWRRIFPKLLRAKEDMPDSLRKHIRYPEGLLLAQGLVYARYHMTDPEVFYNQEDLWVRATEKYYANVQAVEPYYVMWQPPEKDAEDFSNKREGSRAAGDEPPPDHSRPEFILMQPFTPKDRQVLIGWIAGMSDGENYGRLLSYRFPKDKRVLGTQQVETKIDQDPYLSKQLSLWDQRGSQVVRGNVLAIPVGETMLYVEPIYLQADAAAYPELRLVALMHNDELSYADNFEDALVGLYDSKAAPSTDPSSVGQGVTELAGRANQAFDSYRQALADKQFDMANKQLQLLSETLQKLDSRASSSEASAATASKDP